TYLWLPTRNSMLLHTRSNYVVHVRICASTTRILTAPLQVHALPSPHLPGARAFAFAARLPCSSHRTHPSSWSQSLLEEASTCVPEQHSRSRWVCWGQSSWPARVPRGRRILQ